MGRFHEGPSHRSVCAAWANGGACTCDLPARQRDAAARADAAREGRCGAFGVHGWCERPAGHEDDHRAGDWSWHVLAPVGVPGARPRTPTRTTWPMASRPPGSRPRVEPETSPLPQWRLRNGEDEFFWRGKWRPSKRPR